MTDYFDRYMFTSNATNFVCPGWVFGGYTWTCLPPNACATDPTSTKQYCCNAGDVCWAPYSVCSSSGSTFTCTSGSYSWCCLKDKEGCTQLAGQINICYSLAHDTLTNISSSVLNETYSSLSSAQPSASSYTFDPLALIAQTQSTSITQTQTTSTQPPTATNSAGPSNNPSDSLSGGAIAGIVIGAVAAVAIVCIAAFILVRRRQVRNGPARAGISQGGSKYTEPEQSYQKDSGRRPQEMQADTTHVWELHGYTPQEMEADNTQAAELPGQQASLLSDSRMQWHGQHEPKTY